MKIKLGMQPGCIIKDVFNLGFPSLPKHPLDIKFIAFYPCHAHSCDSIFVRLLNNKE